MRLLFHCLLFGFAFALRMLPLPTVFTSVGILPGSLADESYHLRRIWYSVVNFPASLDFDPYVNFPDGGYIHWPPAFDWLLAAVAWLVVGAEDQRAVEAVAVWIPPILGAACAVATAVLGSYLFGSVGGATAGVLVALLPAHWVFSHIGRVDHHVAVALLQVSLLGVTARWLRTGSPSSSSSGVGLSLVLGLALGAPLLVWPGFLIHSGIAQLATVLAVLLAVERSTATLRARNLAAAHLVAFAVVVPLGVGVVIPQFGTWSPLVLSAFQSAWFVGGAVVLASWAFLWARFSLGQRRDTRAIGALLAGLAVVAAMLLVLVPDLREVLTQGLAWFTEDAEAREVAELAPLDSLTAATRYSLAFFLFPVAWVVVAVGAWRDRSSQRGLVLLWSLIFFALALHQRRFNNSFSVLYALVWGGAAAQGLFWVRSRLRATSWSTAFLVVLVGIGAAASLIPVAAYYQPVVLRAMKAWRGEATGFQMQPARIRVHLGAARWLARSTPPTRGYLDASLRPEYGVMAPWSAGHLLRYFGERPQVQDNFGAYGGEENFARAWEYYFATDEATAVELLDGLGVRYVVVDRTGAGTPRRVEYSDLSMAARLARAFGSAREIEVGVDGRVREVSALTQHRLVYHARSVSGPGLATDWTAWSVAVYERVEGARVTGEADPGATVEARLRFTTQSGVRLLPRATDLHVYRVRTQADAAGRYRLRLPYPTDESFSDAVRTVGRYELSTPERTATFSVTEDAVQTGSWLPGPRLRTETSRRDEGVP